MGLYNNSGYNTNNIWLVVEPTPLKNMKVSWDDDIPNIWKNKTQSKPPTIYIYISIATLQLRGKSSMSPSMNQQGEKVQQHQTT